MQISSEEGDISVDKVSIIWLCPKYNYEKVQHLFKWKWENTGKISG